ncbi:hypothetical protein M427DRAFT_461127 [Gonapodya prolifera JEL478]|uniref:Uncharacterized protein n=1 Tax=Gonapodya prolifera (strain JEL478) TaxID=1344416 RepID=A0A139A1V1_GONPJ|nr:hypothetical protein M427DRAFT_461127 [Gonapodya prolifera JEL478]|eukprot:KXS10770.1 hypothetical protein M427DRAFT_461127 [Gonapodya prolifera JEL478]
MACITQRTFTELIDWWSRISDGWITLSTIACNRVTRKRNSCLAHPDDCIAEDAIDTFTWRLILPMGSMLDLPYVLYIISNMLFHLYVRHAHQRTSHRPPIDAQEPPPGTPAHHAHPHPHSFPALLASTPLSAACFFFTFDLQSVELRS